MRHGRLEEAEQSLRRTANPHHYDGQNLGAYIAYMQHADKLAQLESKNGSFKDLFRGTNLRRTEIVSKSIHLAR